MLLLALSSSALATTFHAPFRGSSASAQSAAEVVGCGTSTGSPGNWSPTTGAFTLSERASGKPCTKILAGIGDSTYVWIASEFQLAVPIHFNSSTNQSVTVNWGIDAAASESTVNGTCRPSTTGLASWYCEREADWFVSGDAYLVNLSNQSYSFGSGFDAYDDSVNDTFVTGGKFDNATSHQQYGTFGVSNETVIVNTTVWNRSASYALVVYLIVETLVDFYLDHAILSGASAVASVVMSGGPHQATIRSIVVH